MILAAYPKNPGARRETIMNFALAFKVIMPISMTALAIFMMKKSQTRIAELKTKNFDWNRRTYPQALKDGKPSCYACGSERHHVNPMHQLPTVREHFCVDCMTVDLESSS